MCVGSTSHSLPSALVPEGAKGLVPGGPRLCGYFFFKVVRCVGKAVCLSRLLPAVSVFVWPSRFLILARRYFHIFSRCSIAVRCSCFSSVVSLAPFTPRSSRKCVTVLVGIAPPTPSIKLHCATFASGSYSRIAVNSLACCCSALASWSAGRVSRQYLTSRIVYCRRLLFLSYLYSSASGTLCVLRCSFTPAGMFGGRTLSGTPRWMFSCGIPLARRRLLTPTSADTSWPPLVPALMASTIADAAVLWRRVTGSLSCRHPLTA